MRGFVSVWTAAAVALAAAGCGGDGPTSPGSGPSVTILGPSTVSVVVGDTLKLSAEVSGTSGASGLETVTWRALGSSYASVSGGAVVGLRPGTAYIVAEMGNASDTVTATVTARPNGYTAAEVDYFTEVALGFEFGTASETVRRWNQPIRYRVNGSPDAADRATLARVVGEINSLTSTVDMVEVTEDPLIEIHFAPVSQFPGILPSYTPGNVGYFSVWFNASGHFTRAVVLISTDHEQEVQNHLIREEVSQTLGLGKDSFLYPESIFYQNWTLGAEYAAVDRALVEMLYRPEVSAGMDQTAVTAVLRRLTRGVVAPAALVTAEAAGASGESTDEVGWAAGGTPGR